MDDERTWEQRQDDLDYEQWRARQDWADHINRRNGDGPLDDGGASWNEDETDGRCWQCGARVRIQWIEKSIAQYTGEWIDEDEPEIETLTATGWSYTCSQCGYMDCDPPQF